MYRVRWFFVLGCFLLYPAACGILLPQPGVEPGPLAGVAQILPLGIPRIQFLNLLSRSQAFLFPAPRDFLNTSPNCVLSIKYLFICHVSACTLFPKKEEDLFTQHGLDKPRVGKCSQPSFLHTKRR